MNKFDELAKGLAQSVTRRQALRRFGVSLAGMALACFGLANRAKAATINGQCVAANASVNLYKKEKNWVLTGVCSGYSAQFGCLAAENAACTAGENVGNAKLDSCGRYVSSRACSFAF